MKAEMAVRSISASISACAARMAPRMTSSVTGSQDTLCFADSEALAGASPGASFKRRIGRVLDGDEHRRRDQRERRVEDGGHRSAHDQGTADAELLHGATDPARRCRLKSVDLKSIDGVGVGCNLRHDSVSM